LPFAALSWARLFFSFLLLAVVSCHFSRASVDSSLLFFLAHNGFFRIPARSLCRARVASRDLISDSRVPGAFLLQRFLKIFLRQFCAYVVFGYFLSPRFLSIALCSLHSRPPLDITTPPSFCAYAMVSLFDYCLCVCFMADPASCYYVETVHIPPVR